MYTCVYISQSPEINSVSLEHISLQIIFDMISVSSLKAQPMPYLLFFSIDILLPSKNAECVSRMLYLRNVCLELLRNGR